MSSTQCQSCGGASADLFLCQRHITDLRHLLDDLPQWIEWLHDAAYGQVRLSDGGRGGSRREPFKGDDAVPNGDPAKLRAQFLAAGRANARASTQLDAVRNSLGTWIRHLCETRGIRLVQPKFIGPLRQHEARGPHRGSGHYARWLGNYVQAIACDEAAGELYAELASQRATIEVLINRPVRQVWIGQCPTWNERTRVICGVSLWAAEDAVEARCTRCRATHNCDRLKLSLFNDLEHERVTWGQILKANKAQPEDRQVPERTLQSWRRGKDGQPARLQVRGYLRPNGQKVADSSDPDDQPLYLWPDVRRLRDARPQKMATGAAARK